MSKECPLSGRQEQEQEASTKSRTHNIFRPGIQSEEVVSGYDEWSENYDEIIREGWYNAPGITLREILQRIPPPQRPSCRVLDVAAGTGRVGKDLRREGFKHIDAVEPSEGMMKKLREGGAYTQDFLECVGAGNSSVPAASYDLVVIAGGMGEGHVPVCGMDDLIRAAKKGCFVIIVMRESFLEIVEAYRDKLEPYMEQLERKGAWKKIERKVVPNYYFDNNGVVFTYQVE